MAALYSFVSYREGLGRTSLVVNLAEALITQGCNVLLIDLATGGSGFFAFSSVQHPDPMFQPDCLYQLGSTEPLSAGISIEDADDSDGPKSVEIAGLMSPLENPAKAGTSPDGGDVGADLPLYECRSQHQHPLEGRLLVLPAGGRFELAAPAEHAPDVAATRWIHYAGTKKGHSPQTGSAMRSSHFLRGPFEELREAVLRKAGQHGISLDYILVDEPATTESEQLLSSHTSDGIVLVSGCGRDNLAGAKHLLADIYSGEHLSESGRTAPPPVVGLVISPVLESAVTSKEGAHGEVVKTLANHVRQVGWVELLHHLRKTGRLRLDKPYESTPYFSLQCAIHSRLEHEKVLADDPQSSEGLWGEAPADFPELGIFFTASLPYFWSESKYIQERVAGIRDLSQDHKTAPGDLGRNLRSVIALAGHLRSLNQRDHDFLAWSLWAESHQRTTENMDSQWKDTNCQQSDCPWQVNLYYGLCLANEKRSADADKQLSTALDKQEAIARAIDPNWQGDWRILLRRARVRRDLGDTAKSHDDFARVLKCFEGRDGPGDASIVSIRADVQYELGLSLRKAGDILGAWENFKAALSGHRDSIALAETLIDFLDAYAEAADAGAAKAYFDTVSDFIENQSKIAGIRPQLVLTLARLRMKWYWRRLAEAPDKEKLDFLEQPSKALRELATLREAGALSPTDVTVPALVAEVSLECASIEKDESSRLNLASEAMDSLLEAVQLEPHNPMFHLLLSLVRHVHMRRTKRRHWSVHNDQTAGEESPDTPEVRIHKRDAFYSLEQAVDLWARKHSEKNFYYLDKEASILSDELPAALEVLANRCISEVYRRPFERWHRALTERPAGLRATRRVAELIEKPFA